MTDSDALVAIERVLRTYADVCSRRAWPEMAAIAGPETVFTFALGGDGMDLVGPEAFGAFSDQVLARFSFYDYLLANFVIDLDPSGERATGRSYSVEIGQDAESGSVTTFYGAYDDEFARTDGTWRFSRRTFRVLATL